MFGKKKPKTPGKVLTKKDIANHRYDNSVLLMERDAKVLGQLLPEMSVLLSSLSELDKYRDGEVRV